MSDGHRWHGVRDVNKLVIVVFSGLSALVIEGVADEGGLIRVTERTRDDPVPCPERGTPTGRVHGFHGRRVADVPIDGWRVVVSVRLRRLVCPVLGCSRQTFREQVPGVVERYQRRTNRLAGQLSSVSRSWRAGRVNASHACWPAGSLARPPCAYSSAGRPRRCASRACSASTISPSSAGTAMPP